MDIAVTRDRFQLKSPFAIARGVRHHADVLTVTIRAGGVTGRGECVPSARYGESLDSVTAQIDAVAARAAGMDRQRPFSRRLLAEWLPPGAARNAVDCALWDREAKQGGCRVWDLAGLPAPASCPTALTLSLDSPAAMGAAAAANAHRPLLKIKLGGGAADLDRLRAVRRHAPAPVLIVDANEGWTPALYQTMAPQLAALGVAMLEQPLPAGEDAALGEMARPLPVCADESCHDRASLPALAGKYDMVNVKLDKTGGLTEALALTEAARQAGFGVMVGCMLGSSLAMAPALLPAMQADFVDLDGPLLLAGDRQPALQHDAAGLHPPLPALWG